MEPISSRYTVAMRWLLPLLWLAVAGYLVAIDFLDHRLLSLAGAVAFSAVVVFLMMETHLWDAADEVLDAGSYLVVRKRGEEDTVPLSDVVSVSDDTKARMPLITLHLRKPGKFGAEVRFFPARTGAFHRLTAQRHPVAEALIARLARPEGVAAPIAAKPPAASGKMDKISSPYTFIMKRVFPVVVFGVFGIIAFNFLARGEVGIVLVLGLVAATVGIHLMTTFWPAVDAVFDAGTHLVVRSRGKELQVQYLDVQNVSFSSGPDRITLRLARPGELDEEIVFFPVANKLGDAFGSNRICDKLMAKVSRAKANRA